MSASVIKVGVVYMDIWVSRYLNEKSWLRLQINGFGLLII